VGCCCADRLGAAATLLFEEDFDVRSRLPDVDDSADATSPPDLTAGVAAAAVETVFTVLVRLVCV
jgi:hypothetical protein